jgi:anti-sigma factor ChrR (cupin superfamily)
VRVPGLLLSLDASALPWRATKSVGVSWYPLHVVEGGGPGTDSTVLVKMEPGCGYPPHRHLDVEEVLVLAGTYRDGSGDHPAGSYLRYPAQSAHAPVAAGDEPCVLFAVARGGIALDRDSR